MKRHYCTKEDIELNTENITIFLSKRYDFIPHRKRNLKKTCLQCDCEQCYYARSQRNGLLE